MVLFKNFFKALKKIKRQNKCSCGAKKEATIGTTPYYSPQYCSNCGEENKGHSTPK